MHPHRPFNSFLAVLTLLLGGCRDGTGPDPTFALTLHVIEVDGPEIGDAGDGERLLWCEAHLRLTASGEGVATWQPGVMRFYFGASRTTATDSVDISTTDLNQVWQIRNRAELSRPALWRFIASAPFEVEVELRYRVSDRTVRSANVRIPCGLSEVENAPPPSITRFQIVQPTGPLEPAGSLDVVIEATSAIGLWQTDVAFLGPCEAIRTFHETLDVSIARTVRLEIPVGCALGVPITVALRVLDAALQQSVVTLPSALQLVDETPPELFTLFFPPFGGATTTIEGDYFVGEAIAVEVSANDNHVMRSLGWEVLPSSDTWTKLVTGPFAHQRLDIPVPPHWLGEIQIRFFASDVSGNVQYSPFSEPRAVTVYPTTEHPTRSATVPGQIREFVIDERRDVVYLLQTNERRLAVLSSETMQVIETLPLPSAPLDLALSASGDSLILTMPLLGALAIVDLTRPGLEAETLLLQALDATVEQQPWRVRVTVNGKAFIGLQGSNEAAWTLLELDFGTGEERIRVDAGDHGQVGGAVLEVSLDRSVLVMQGGPDRFQRYDAGTDGFGQRRSAIPYSWPPAVSGTGRRTAIGLHVFDEALESIGRVDSRIPHGASLVSPSALTPDGEHLYHAYAALGLIRSRTSDGRIVDRTPTPFAPDRILMSPSGRRLVIVENLHAPTTRIAILDLVH